MSNPSRNNLLDKVRSFRLSKADFRQLTNSGLTHKGRQTLARMFPRNFSDLTSRPILGPVGHIRIGYLAASAVSVWAAASASTKVTYLIKPSLMPLLCASCSLFATPVNRRIGLEKWTDTGLLVGGLAFGCLGDVILMGREGRSKDGVTRARNLNKGSCAFAVNQLAYHALLIRLGARPKKSNLLLRVPVVFGAIGLAVWKNPNALPAAAGYGALLGATSILAEAYCPEAAFGGNVFVLSDALILARLAFLIGTPKIDSLVDGAVMTTYSVAQLLITDAISRGIVEDGRALQIC